MRCPLGRVLVHQNRGQEDCFSCTKKPTKTRPVCLLLLFPSTWSLLQVSTRNSASSARNQEHVIHVYTSDYTNIEDVMNIEYTLRTLGVSGKMVYRPDIYNVLGIYFVNPWEIPQYVYTTHKWMSGSLMTDTWLTRKETRSWNDSIVDTRRK